MMNDLIRRTPNLSDYLAEEAAWFEDDAEGELIKVFPIGNRLDFWTATIGINKEDE